MLTLASFAAVSSVRWAGPRLATISSAAWRIDSRESLFRLTDIDVELGAWLIPYSYEKPVAEYTKMEDSNQEMDSPIERSVH